MITGVFEKEKNEMITLINSRNVLQNFIYKLDNDLNFKTFLSELLNKAKYFDNMEHMKLYYFKKDLKEVGSILNLFYQGLISDGNIKSKNSSELIKCCNLFPDHIGKKSIEIISYLPLVDLLVTKINYLDAIDMYLDLENKEYFFDVLKNQEDKIINGTFGRKFFKDKDFLDYELRNRYSENLKREYLDFKKKDIDYKIESLLSIYENSDNLSELKVKIGMAYWDEKNAKRKIEIEKFAKLFEGMVNELDK